MSKRHQASRRRSYGRRQHELHERADRGAAVDVLDEELPAMAALDWSRDRFELAAGDRYMQFQELD